MSKITVERITELEKARQFLELYKVDKLHTLGYCNAHIERCNDTLAYIGKTEQPKRLELLEQYETERTRALENKKRLLRDIKSLDECIAKLDTII